MRLPAVLAALGLLAPLASAQAPTPQYLHVSYMRVDPAAGDDYASLEREVWRPVHAERRRRGAIQGWSLYRVEYAPPGTGYDYVTVTVYDALSKMEGEGREAAFQAAHPDADVDAMTGRTLAAREEVHSEIWALVEAIQPEGAPGPVGRYVAVNFMDVPLDGGAEYFSMEREVWAPIHQVRADDGSMGGWALYSLVLPQGEAMDYRFGTVDFFEDLDAATAGITGAQIQRAHGEASEDEVDAMMDRTDRARAIHKTELWTLIDSLEGPDG
jgi:hypothetical protein